MRAQRLGEFLGDARCVGVQKLSLVRFRTADACEDFLLRLRGEARNRAHLAGAAGRLEIRDRDDAQLVVQGANFLRTQTRNGRERQQTFRNRGAQLLVIFQPSGFHHLGDLQPQRFAKPDGTEIVVRDKFRDVARKCVERPRGLGVGERLERILALQLKKNGDFLQHVDDLILVHAKAIFLIGSPSVSRVCPLPDDIAAGPLQRWHCRA